MSNPTRKMIPRAPRYVLGPSDDNLMRFAFMETQGRSAALKTTLVNLSETGLAFLIDPVLAPDLDEIIKIELPIPGAQQIAWFGKVVRIEEQEPLQWWFLKARAPEERPSALVAIRFEELPSAQRTLIRQGLEKSFAAALRAERRRRLQQWKHVLFLNAPRLAAVALLVSAVLALFFYLIL